MEKTYTWFLEPLDKHTNDVIASELGGENFERPKEFPEGLWHCKSYALISRLKASKSQLNLKFNIFVREGGGKIRRFFS